MPLFLRPTARLLAALSLTACSATGSSSFTGPTGTGGTGGGSSTTTTATGTTGTGGSTGTSILGDAGFGGLGAGGGNPDGCIEGTQFVYTLAEDNTLYSFYPPTLAFTAIGVLDCPTAEGPFSMAVDRNGTAWVVFTDGSLWNVSTANAHCTATGYVPGQHNFTTFGMGFSSNAVGSTDETLFVSESGFSTTTLGLAKIDTTSLALTPIGMYDQLDARAEMTGTGDARLFGAFEGTPYIVAQIEKTDAKILSQAPQNAINYAPDTSNFAFAFWGGDFWLFVGPGTSTDVFHYVVSTGVTTKVKTVSFEIVGAGVSTCAPIVPPT